MFVENRPGANSTIGLASVARAAPDGYTLVMVAQSALIAPRMMRNPPYDPVRDFAGREPDRDACRRCWSCIRRCR